MGSIPSPRSLLVLVFVFRRRKNTTHRRTRRRRRRRRTRRVTPRELQSVKDVARTGEPPREEESFFNAIGNWKKVKRIHTHKEMRKAARTKEHNKARDDRNAPEGLSPAPGTSHGLIASPDASGVSFVDDPPFVKVVVSHGFGGGGVPTDILFIRHFPRGTFSSPFCTHLYVCRQ